MKYKLKKIIPILLMLVLLAGSVYAVCTVPAFSFISNVNDSETETLAVLTAVATASFYPTVEGIKYIRIYEDNGLIDEKNCGNTNPCVHSKAVYHEEAATHTYYATTENDCGNTRQSGTITIVFTGPAIPEADELDNPSSLAAADDPAWDI